MGPAVPSPRSIRFGVFELDLRSGELQKQGRKIRLEGQPVQVLKCLLESPGELVTRDELHRKLWPADTFVNFEHGLNAAVKRLRQALSDAADNPRFVETLPRRGYRFIAPIQVVPGSEAVATPSAPDSLPERVDQEQIDPPDAPLVSEPRRRPHAWKTLAFVLLLVVGISTVLMLRSRSNPPVIRSLAVLPLENLSGDASEDYFSDGMTDELITELGQIAGLRVISRTSMMTYKGARKSIPQIAHELNVDAVVEGTVLRSGNQVRITAQLIQAEDDKHLWARSYEGELRDTFSLQNEVARAIATQIRTKLNPPEDAALRNTKVVNPEAYEAYLKGRYFWNKRTGSGLTEAIRYFTKAIDADPNYARAYAGLADSYALAGDWKYGVLSPREAYPKAKAAAAKAIALDSTLGEAHISLAFCLDGFDWNWESGGREFKRGIELSPDYATGHDWYGWHLAEFGRNDEAIAEVETAVGLDPLSLIIGADLAEEFVIAHRFEQAITQSRKTMTLDPFFGNAHYVMGQALAQERRYKEATAELQKAIELSPGSSAFAANLAFAYASSGRTEDALKILNGQKNRPPDAFSNAAEVALIYVGLNDKDQAMVWLEKAYAERFNPAVLMRPCFDPLRSDARFHDLLRRIGLMR
jgi:TolB-like protein/DNA-binding winged helix-turn-helix (wHTH) protein/Tfp pilus assembly protein PilF